MATGGGQRAVAEAIEYEKLLVLAGSCNISRAAVDAKLLTHSVKQAFDWIASGEAVPLPGYAASHSPSSGLAIRSSMNVAADPPIISR